jgi:hypothetical protein
MSYIDRLTTEFISRIRSLWIWGSEAAAPLPHPRAADVWQICPILIGIEFTLLSMT